MRYKVPLSTLLLMISCLSSAGAELKLAPVHPDEPIEYTYERRFSPEMALLGLQKIHAYLDSFRSLTEEAKRAIPPQRLKDIGNTDWETQHLGFTNTVGSIEGTLRKQDYLIKELRYELTKEKMKQKMIGEKELQEAQEAFEQAAKSFRAFWGNFRIAD